MGTVEIRITVSDEKHSELTVAKGDRTWLEVLEDGAEVNDE